LKKYICAKCGIVSVAHRTHNEVAGKPDAENGAASLIVTNRLIFTGRKQYVSNRLTAAFTHCGLVN